MDIIKNLMTQTTFTKWLLIFVISTSLFSAAQVHAAETPDKVVGGAVQNLLDEFSTRRSEFESDKQALFSMVEEVTDPYFDFDKISKLILSKNWKKATDVQRQDFRNEFRTLLIKTYATALFQYTGKEKMDFKSSKIKERKGVKSAIVQSEVTLSEGPPIPVNYSLILDKDDNWKIYNMSIAGINLVTSYRDTYGASIRKQGLDGLIQSMKETNAKS